MLPEEISVRYYPHMEIACARLPMRWADECVECEGDPCLLFEVDRHGFVVGLVLLDAVRMTAEAWEQHPGAALAPGALKKAIGAWLAARYLT